MKNKKQIRNKFRQDVFTRDGECRICGEPILDDNMDAHHITDRNEMPNGGYVLENGITVCKDDCHMQVELFHISGGNEWNKNMHPDDLYELIGSSKELAIEKSKLL
jgi:5-methylcytosine-specific restriction endonuclease McrA